MNDFLESMVGEYGPLIVEHQGKLYIECCVVIQQNHIESMKSKIEHIRYNSVQQTTDRSFLLC